MSNKWFTVASNVSYLLPAGVCAYKMTTKEERRLDKYDGAELITLFLFVAFFSSWSYHSCRADLSPNDEVDRIDIPPCEVCPMDNSMSWTTYLPGSDSEMNFQIARFIDYFLAIFTIIIVLITVLPFHDRLRKFIMVFSVIWMMLFLSTGNEWFALIPAMILFLFMLLFWFTLRKQKECRFWTRNKIWMLALIFMLAAITCFKISPEPYWLKHGLWHIFGAISVAFLIGKTASCYQDVDLDQIDFPDWMRAIFVAPGFCKRYD